MSNVKPIRVAQIIGKMWAGGVEAVVFNYYRAIDHSKIQFDFFYDSDSTVEPPQDLIDMGARFIKMPPYQHVWKYIPELRKKLRVNKYLIVHSHLNSISVIPLYAAWCEKVPVRIAHNHSVPGGDEWRRNIAKAVLKKFSKVFATNYFACSEKAGRWLFGDKEFESGNVSVIKNAIDFSRFQISETDIIMLRKKLAINDENIVYGHIGRFTFAKNHEKLLEIFKIIYERNEKAILLLVGDGELRETITNKINALGIDKAVIMVGKVNKPEIYYSVINVVILPSVFEGFSMTTIEAQASGCPIVVSEAVPDEAKISDGCSTLTLMATNYEWASVAENLVDKKISLDKRAATFDIQKCAEILEKFYETNVNIML